MKQSEITEKRLQELLHALPDQEVPGDLSKRIMAEIQPYKKAKKNPLAKLLDFSFTFKIQPLRLALDICTLILAFWVGLIVGGRLDNPINPKNFTGSFLTAASDNAQANYLMGRGLLTGGQSQQAIRFLQKASLLDPLNPEYALWEGVALGKEQNREQERNIYKKIISRYPTYLPARMYLAHNLLETGQLQEALKEYTDVLKLYPQEETALYNKALTFQLMGNKVEEAVAWKNYLHQMREGKWAYRAVHHLNQLGDFSYRNYQIGFRKIILNQETLLGEDTEAIDKEINFLAASFANSSGQDLHLILFLQDRKESAEKKALHLKKLISNSIGHQQNKKIKASWFGKPENIQLDDGRDFQLPDGLLIFSQPTIQKSEEKRI